MQRFDRTADFGQQNSRKNYQNFDEDQSTSYAKLQKIKKITHLDPIELNSDL
jgi:hypothetical protein